MINCLRRSHCPFNLPRLLLLHSYISPNVFQQGVWASPSISRGWENKYIVPPNVNTGVCLQPGPSLKMSIALKLHCILVQCGYCGWKNRYLFQFCDGSLPVWLLIVGLQWTEGVERFTLKAEAYTHRWVCPFISEASKSHSNELAKKLICKQLLTEVFFYFYR